VISVGMAGRSFLRRLQRVSGRELGDFAEAMFALTAASAAIKLLPFRTVVRTMNCGQDGHERRPSEYGELAVAIRRAVTRATTRLPLTIVCFPEGLAAHRMLRRRGAPSLVHYGLRQSESKLSAHVWVTLGETVVVGEETTDFHTCVAVFPHLS
jgi:hypothetical protein